jgi:predicted RNase H-like nuclease (RuvC/YqgF family)
MVFNSVEDRFKNLKNTIDIMKERIKELKDTIFEKNKIIADLESQIKVFELNKI